MEGVSLVCFRIRRPCDLSPVRVVQRGRWKPNYVEVKEGPLCYSVDSGAFERLLKLDHVMI